MPRCPLCSERPAKRYCPAKTAGICGYCCGTKREVEIDCPGSCPHLLAGRAYENDHREPDAELIARVRTLDKTFPNQYRGVLTALTLSVASERQESPWLVDTDVIEALKALYATTKTLAAGLLYETLPDGAHRQSLYRKLKTVLDKEMNPPPGEPVFKVSEALAVLDFFTYMVTFGANKRPRSRQYLDDVSRLAGHASPEPTSRLIVP